MKKGLIIVLCVVAVALIGGGIYIVQNQSTEPTVAPTVAPTVSPTGDPVNTFDPGQSSTDTDFDYVTDLSALASKTETHTVQPYALTMSAFDVEPFVPVIFGSTTPEVETYEEDYDGVTLKITEYYLEDEDFQYLGYIENRYVRMSMEDFYYSDVSKAFTEAEVSQLLNDLLVANGISLDHYEAPRSAVGVYLDAEENDYYCAMKPIDGIEISYYGELCSYIATGENGIAFLYFIDYDTINPSGATVTTLSAWDAAQAFENISEDERYFYGDLIMKDAKLVYDIVYVTGQVDKVKLVPVWEFTCDDGSVYQVDAQSGVIWDGYVETSVSLESWNGAE